MKPAPSHALARLLDYVRKGGRLFVPSAYRLTVIDARVLKKFEAAGIWLLRERGESYQMHSGKSSVYILPGQLQIEE